MADEVAPLVAVAETSIKSRNASQAWTALYNLGQWLQKHPTVPSVTLLQKTMTAHMCYALSGLMYPVNLYSAGTYIAALPANMRGTTALVWDQPAGTPFWGDCKPEHRVDNIVYPMTPLRCLELHFQYNPAHVASYIVQFVRYFVQESTTPTTAIEVTLAGKKCRTVREILSRRAGSGACSKLLERFRVPIIKP
jgi:hypothetical protein